MTAENQAKAQHTFDVVAAHLLTQNALSIDPILGCAYRGEHGARCAVGFCIPNDKYKPYFEGIGVKLKNIPHSRADKVQEEILDAVDSQYVNDAYFLGSLQDIHDTATYLDGGLGNWPTMLKQFAADYKLDDSVVDTFTTATIPQPEVTEYAQ